MDEMIKTCTLCFSAKENPNVEKVLFDWPPGVLLGILSGGVPTGSPNPDPI